MEAVRSEATADELFVDKTAEDGAVAVDWRSLCSPTAGSHPLVDARISGSLVLSDGKSDGDRCAVGDVCRIVRVAAAAGVDPRPGEVVGDG